MIYFSNMCYGVYYYVVKFQLKTPPMHGEIKRINCIRGQNKLNGIVYGGKLNQIII